MSKKSTTEKTVFEAAAPFEFGVNALKSGFEKSMSAFAGAETAAKDNIEAGIESAMIAGAGIQTLNTEAYAFAQKSVEDAITVTKSLFGAKSLIEAFQIQADFAKTSYFANLKQAARYNELLTSTTKDSFAPLQSRADAVTKLVPTFG